MNLEHFERLRNLFENHRNQDGSSGFDFLSLKDAIGDIIKLDEEQMRVLYMKIDANSYGSIDWNDFANHMMTVAGERDEITTLVDERRRKISYTPHKDMIVYLDYVQKERKYLSISRDGLIGLWSLSMVLHRMTSLSEFLPFFQAWILDAKFMAETSRLIVVTDNDYEENTDLVLFGDDGGYVNVLTINRRFLLENNSDNGPSEYLNPVKLLKKDSLEKYNISLYQKKVHEDWVLKVSYYSEMNSFVSCSLESDRSLVIGDLERKTTRHISVPRGIETFEFCKRPSSLITGGRDRILRLWNPYAFSKPTGILRGHLANILKIVVNNEEGIIFSLSEDKVIKLWNARNLMPLQTLVDKVAHRPENTISAIFYDSLNRQIITGSNKIEVWPLYSNSKHLTSKGQDVTLISVLYNPLFGHIVSGNQAGTITIWSPLSGEKIFEYLKCHGDLELTAMCFDKSMRRLITGCRDKAIKMWNYNNGQLLRTMMKSNAAEISQMEYIEMGESRYLVAVGWDRKVTVFSDELLESHPIRVLNSQSSPTLAGHGDDINSLSHMEPNLLATSSADGIILIWNMDTGFMKKSMTEPTLELKSREERSVEKVLFINRGKRLSGAVYPLLSCHSDGFLRVWNVHQGKMLLEYNAKQSIGEGLVTLSRNEAANLLLVGGSYGHLNIMDLTSILGGTLDKQTLILRWRAHLTAIVSAVFVQDHSQIITGAAEGAIRLWNHKGEHFGTFGDQPYGFKDSMLGQLPRDLKHEDECNAKELIQQEKQQLEVIVPVATESRIDLFESTLISKDIQRIPKAFFTFESDSFLGKVANTPLKVDFASIYHSLPIQSLDDTIYISKAPELFGKD